MFKNLKEDDKKKIYTLAALSFVCIMGLAIFTKNPVDKKDKETFEENKDQKSAQVEVKKDNDLESQLKNILSQIEGAGEVDVMITFSSGEQIEPAFNSNATKEETTEKDAQGGERTVTTSSENKTMITYNLWIRTTMQCRHTHSKLSFPAPISKCSFTIPKSILV